jgi:hypothetical protein
MGETRITGDIRMYNAIKVQKKLLEGREDEKRCAREPSLPPPVTNDEECTKTRNYVLWIL